ncbi:MAG: histidine phosphatase family protein [Sulfurimonas sp.]|nr:histidine phosphatase family protein [Sulfurimonas sp.]
MNITLVRHAEVVASHIGKYNGHIDIVLSKNGKVQAKELAEKLALKKFDKVYCSDLLRARQTLDAFKLDCEIVYTSALREKSWGIHEGKSFEEIEASGIKYENFEQWIHALDGEDISLYTKNVKNYFEQVVLKESLDNILIISHSGFIKSLISDLQGITLEEAFSIKLPYSSPIYIQTKNLLDMIIQIPPYQD